MKKNKKSRCYWCEGTYQFDKFSRCPHCREVRVTYPIRNRGGEKIFRLPWHIGDMKGG